MGGFCCKKRRQHPEPQTTQVVETDIVDSAPTGEDCAICLSPIVTECAQTRCGHHFHKPCLDQHIAMSRKQQAMGERECSRTRCPICRRSIHVPFFVDASSTSGRRVEVLEVPGCGAFCHFDRSYTFRSLGSFQKPGMLYIKTSNDDRKTRSSQVMWVLETSKDVIVHLNFRSDEHAARTGTWIHHNGWFRNNAMRSTVSTGIPNGPYSGPVYSKSCPPGRINLMGSDTWEGVYFVFVEPAVTTLTTPDTSIQVSTDFAVVSPARQETLTAAADAAADASLETIVTPRSSTETPMQDTPPDINSEPPNNIGTPVHPIHESTIGSVVS